LLREAVVAARDILPGGYWPDRRQAKRIGYFEIVEVARDVSPRRRFNRAD
jgi:hypothetical protein